MPHDETGSAADLNQALTPAVRALAANERSTPPSADKVNTFSYATVLRNEPPGAWGQDVWEQVNNYKGAVALAVRPIMTAFRGADYKVLKRKRQVVQKAQGGRHKWSRDDAYEPVEDHPLCDILRAPGGPKGAWSFGYECAYAYLQYLLTGNAAFWFPSNADGKPCQVFALTTTSVQVAYWPGASTAYPQGAYRVLPYATGAGFGSMGYMTSTALLPGEEVRILREPDPLSRQLGRSRLRMGAMEIDVLKSINEFRWNYFDTGVALDTVVSLPGADNDTVKRVGEVLTQKHGGARNARRVAVFGGAAGMEGGKGATIQNLSPNAKDLDFPNGFEQALGQVLAFFGVPKILAGFDDSSNYATYIGQKRRFYQECLLPEFAGLSEFLTTHLAGPWSDEPGEYVIVAEPEVPEDLEQEQQELQFAVQQDIISINEYRKSTAREEVPDGDLPLSAYRQKVQQQVAPPPMPGMDPNATPDTSGAGAGLPPDQTGTTAAPEGDDSEQGTQDATLQAALAALGMGGNDAGPDEEPVQKAAAPVNDPKRKVRAEGERWTGADGKQWTKKGGKIVPAPAQGGGKGGPGATESRPAGQSAPAPAQPQTGTNAAPERQAHEMSEQESRAAGTKFFRTQGGSLYAMDSQGRTTRVKADHSAQGHDKGDVGLKERSHKTVYVPSNVASALSAAGLQTGDGKAPKSRVVLHDGKATLVTWNEKENKWGATASGRNVATSDKPGKGLSPLELWKPANDVGGAEAYSGMHAGSAITEEVDHATGHAELSKAAGTNAAPKRELNEDGKYEIERKFDKPGTIDRLLKKGGRKYGLDRATLDRLPEPALRVMAAQMGLVPAEHVYAYAAKSVPVTPQSKTHLERANEWADAMAQKHAAKVAQRLGIRPELAQRILAKAIRQIAEHALKTGGKASGTLKVGGQSVRLGVKAPQGERGGAQDGAGERPQPGIAKAMNTLSDPEGGFLVPGGNMPRRKRKRRPVCEIVKKALQGM